MPVLSSDLRNNLEKTITNAREAAESAMEAALGYLGLLEREAPTGLSLQDRKTRLVLREELKRLGGFSWKDIPGGSVDHPRVKVALELLIAEGAYEQWHQMLFARFLAENNLLMHPEYRQPVTLHDCKELAEHEGDRNAWATASRYASQMLPGMFKPHDPLLQIVLAPEGQSRLEAWLESIPTKVFTSDDGLGWIYQFWQTRRKEQVNKSGRKIGGADISPVTQLFTEHYMVDFLLHNTLGSWWASRHPHSSLNARFTYLRRLEDGTPAAGTFAGWPQSAAGLKVLDPCCGSGHFLVATAELLAHMRSEEEGLSLGEAYDAVLRDNLFGLELDPRCTQIAAFNLALQAWKTAGYRQLPLPHVACSGVAVGGSREEWQAMAGDDFNLRPALMELWETFKKAPDLGSLIDPSKFEVRGDLLAAADYEKLEKMLDKALDAETATNDPAAMVFGEAAKGITRAAKMLRGKYHLVITNVPYLARGKQGDTLKEHIERTYPLAKPDLATAFVERCRDFCNPGGSYALVTPQNWLFLGSYKSLRETLLQKQSWNTVARLSEGGFQSAQAAGAFVALLAITNTTPTPSHCMTGLDVSSLKTPAEKAEGLIEGELKRIEQARQLKNPDGRVTLTIIDPTQALLSVYADSFLGLGTGDITHYIRVFWELSAVDNNWGLLQATTLKSKDWGGLEHIVAWDTQAKRVRGMSAAERKVAHNQDYRGGAAWGKSGVCVSLTRDLRVTLYTGNLFDKSIAVLVPKLPFYLPAIFAFCQSSDFPQSVRKIDQNLLVTNASLLKVPFDLEYWTKVAQEKYPNGLPEPYSNDPTQWLFKGTVTDTTETLQVAVARLLGYRWPEQVEDGLPEDADGIVCVNAAAGELPAANRLRGLLAQAYGGHWSATLEQALLASVGYGGKSLEEWLRDGFFAQHCKVFHNRPFIWHVWDGRKDGFSALLNYHKLDRARLEKLIYTYLGDYLTQTRKAATANERGADARLVAGEALQKKLEAILHGEPPYDIFIRWKPLHQQPIGWEPDLNDGVRLNIRPWVMAGVLRSRFTINWNKDRGTDPKPNASGTTERLNDLHLTRQQKEQARQQAEIAN